MSDSYLSVNQRVCQQPSLGAPTLHIFIKNHTFRGSHAPVRKDLTPGTDSAPTVSADGVVLRVAYAWARRRAVRLMEDPRRLQGSKSECTLADMITRGTFASSCMHLYVPAHVFGVGLEMFSLAAYARACAQTGAAVCVVLHYLPSTLPLPVVTLKFNVKVVRSEQVLPDGVSGDPKLGPWTRKR